ncbi:MAG: hypothetical protein IJ176_03780 [Prevotella sp.]|nr:hypothetical protein [Prevotella sp.]
MLMLAAAMTMVSCNLFIEEEDDGSLEFKDVPVQTGEGYDTPVTVKDGDCEVTYQFREGVRYLTERDQQYIVYVQRDEINALVEIHYRLDTPEELLPVPGEILVSGVTDKFDWGCNHKLLNRFKEDGVYKFLGTACSLKEIYSRLDIDGEVMTTEEETYYVLPDPDDGEEESVEAGARTRADDSEDGAGVTFTDSGCKFYAKINWGYTFDLSFGASLAVSMEAEKNSYSITTQMNFDDFSLDNMVFQMIKTVEEQNEVRLTLSGGMETKVGKKIKAFHPVRGKPFTIGPVVIVFFMDIEFSVSLSVNASLVFSKHKKTQYTYTVDIYNMTCKKEEKVLINQPWSVDTELSGSISIRASLILGFGIYGKVISVRLIPYIEAGFEAFLPPRSGDSWDASASKGLDFFVRVGGRIRFVIDFTWENLFGSANTKEEAQKLLKEAKGILEKNSQLYNDMKDDKDVQSFLDEDSEEWGTGIELGPWTIDKLCASWPWFPKLKDSSFKIVKQWSEDGTSLDFNAEYTLNSVGIMASVGYPYYPALMIKKGSSTVRIVTAEEGGSFSEVKKGMTYHFKIKNLKSDVEYTAVPCYYLSSFSLLTSDKPHIVDKGLNFCSHVPSMSLVSVVPTNYEEKEDTYEGYKYRHDFYVDSRVSVKGVQSINNWVVRELVSNTSRGKATSKQDTDGTYVGHWKFTRYSHLSSAEKRQTVHIKMETWYYLNQGDEEPIKGPPYEIKVYSDRTYDEISDESGFGMDGLSYSRQARPQGNTDADDDGPTEVILESIEAPDGTIIWQRGQDELPGLMPL